MAAPQWSGPHAKAKSVGEVKALFRHNDKDRRMEVNHTNPHIDKSKTYENFTYRGLSYKEMCDVFDGLLSSVDMGKPGSGKNARTLMQSVILYPPKGLTREQEKEWMMDAGQVLEARYGKNLIEIQFDMDEEHEYTDKDTGEKVISRNHGHARLFPEVDGKLNGKAFSSRAEIKALNHALDVMSVQKYGVHMMDGTKKKGGVSVEAMKAASLRAEVEQLEEVRDTIITDAINRATEITTEARRDARAARREADDYAYKTRRTANRDAIETADQADQDAQAIREAAKLEAQEIRLQAERDAQAMREQVAAMRRERDEAQADRDAARKDEQTAHQNAQGWAVKARTLQTAHKSLQTALQGDLRAYEAQEARRGATALLDALGATVRPLVMPTRETPIAVRDAISDAMRRLYETNAMNEARWARQAEQEYDGYERI